jgi:hypothetical protein
MNKRKQESTLLLVINLVESLRLQRYRLAIVCGDISTGKSTLAQSASEKLRARYIDLATELLPTTTRPDFSPTLGAYSPENLVRYIMHESGKANSPLLIIDQIEPLVATFRRAGAVQFFQMVGQVEPIEPVILVTYLWKQVEEANFPRERLLDFCGREL